MRIKRIHKQNKEVNNVAYIILGGIWLLIIFWWLIPVMRKHIVHEVYIACGLGILFSLIVLGSMVWKSGEFIVLRYIGWAFYIPAAILVISSFIHLIRSGKPESGWEHSTMFIEDGIFRIVRHPLYLGSALFSVGLMLLIQSIPSALLGIVAIICFGVASKKEDAHNIGKFGDRYKRYIDKVPMWNIFKGVWHLRRSNLG